jgi:hypothetical protein
MQQHLIIMVNASNGAEPVKAEALKLARTVREAMLNIPDRIAAEFARLTNAHAIHARLNEEIQVALYLTRNKPNFRRVAAKSVMVQDGLLSQISYM